MLTRNPPRTVVTMEQSIGCYVITHGGFIVSIDSNILFSENVAEGIAESLPGSEVRVVRISGLAPVVVGYSDWEF